MKIASILPLLILFTFVVAAASVPTATVNAASKNPSCNVVFSHNGITDDGTTNAKVTVPKNDTLIIAWASKNATKAVDSNKKSIGLFGTATVTPSKNTKYSYTFSQGSKKVTCTLSVNVISGSIATKETAKSGEKVTLAGKAEGVKKVIVTIYPVGASTPVYASKSISVRSKKFSLKMPKALADGNYRIQLQTTAREAVILATSSLRVGNVAPVAQTSLVVRTVPLLVGGTAKVGSSVAVAYLQLINVGTSPAQISGFTFNQIGSASPSAIGMVTMADEFSLAKGSIGSLVSGSPFVANKVIVPISVTLAAKESRLFTVRATLGTAATSYVGQTMALSLQTVSGNALVQSQLPLNGVTWTIGR